MTHGSSRKPEEHAEVTPWAFLPQAQWFARRGWVVLFVVRRGYGHSGGEQDGRHAGHCPTTDYQSAAEYAAKDLRVAMDFARTLPNVDPERAIAVGVSTGGLASVALTAQAPPQLVAAINFAGGRGSQADHDVCNPDDLVRTYKNFGKQSRVPMLWLYAQNDKFFWPELAQKFDTAFRSQGGNDQFVLALPSATTATPSSVTSTPGPIRLTPSSTRISLTRCPSRFLKFSRPTFHPRPPSPKTASTPGTTTSSSDPTRPSPSLHTSTASQSRK